MLDKTVSKSEDDDARTRAEAFVREIAAPVEFALPKPVEKKHRKV